MQKDVHHLLEIVLKVKQEHLLIVNQSQYVLKVKQEHLLIVNQILVLKTLMQKDVHGYNHHLEKNQYNHHLEKVWARKRRKRRTVVKKMEAEEIMRKRSRLRM